MYNFGVGKQTLYIITGLPYSGKTILSNELVKRFKFIVCSVDEELDKGNYIVERMVQRDWNYIYSKAYERLKKYLSDGQTVIFDGASLKRSERETLKQIAKSMNIPYKLIYVNTPKEEIKQRWLKNLKTKERDHVKKITLNFAFNLFEEPQPDENPIIYNKDINLERWIKDNLIQD